VNTKFRMTGALVSAGTTLAILAGLGGGVAHADPSPAGNRLIAMVGSETTTPVINALANDAAALSIGGVRQVASFNATGSATIDTHGGTIPACTAVSRPNGSSAGRAAFLASLTAGDGCIQGARASSLALAAANPNLTYIPFAKEAISFAITNTSAFSKNLTLAQVQGYFRCTAGNLFGGGSPYSAPNYRSMLPQNGSGTRSYWITTMDYAGAGITVPNSGAVSGAACVQNGADENGVLIEEHNGTQVNNFEIVPMSVAQYTSQTSGVIATDVRGATRVGQIDGKNPFASDFGLQRDLYNAFAQSDVEAVNPPAGSVAAAIQTLFKGQTSQLCSGAAALAVVKRFGLYPVSNCGDFTSHITP
jgi:ABC-type phosphate transport system substrate-binding protein